MRGRLIPYSDAITELKNSEVVGHTPGRKVNDDRERIENREESLWRISKTRKAVVGLARRLKQYLSLHES